MQFLPYLANIIAICILVFAIYLPRHHRRDLAVAYLGVNVGVMAVSIGLLNSAVAAGLGLGLFGVLSIIRLRSDELAQHEVAYYFSSLALGLLGGPGGSTTTYGRGSDARSSTSTGRSPIPRNSATNWRPVSGAGCSE